MKVVADMVCQEEIVKACHQGVATLQEYRVRDGHLGRNRTEIIIVVRRYFPHIFKLVTEIINLL